ncbi:hypothetical protein [Thermococcus barophilus]|uniref:Uncharacterized protein n=1 Tax=Thermococcus barophilus TaxID=55802 RepID=A0A0S1XFF0_THEBA|nr:hypothetical protein [Thermococcus barophilus]ALM76466.1 conserved exported hypothetical protein [Thermococcus barophilus]
MIMYEEALITALATAVITAITTVGANKALLQRITNQLDELENRVFDHERRLSKLEGKINGAKVV